MELKTIEKALSVLKCFTQWDFSLVATELHPQGRCQQNIQRFA
jgi:hypothetical protein